jgi:hypothetical protein
MPKYRVSVEQHIIRRAEVEIEIMENQGPETEDEIRDIISGMTEDDFDWPSIRTAECEVQVLNYVVVE